MPTVKQATTCALPRFQRPLRVPTELYRKRRTATWHLVLPARCLAAGRYRQHRMQNTWRALRRELSNKRPVNMSLVLVLRLHHAGLRKEVNEGGVVVAVAADAMVEIRAALLLEEV